MRFSDQWSGCVVSQGSSRHERLKQADGLGGLVLARQLGQSIVIGDSISIEVVGLKASHARLKLVAPRAVSIHRREVFDSIRLSSDGGLVMIGPTADLPRGDDSNAVGSLVLTRKAGQTIMIGHEIAVDVVETRPGTVRLRIIAPRSIAVHRRELLDSTRGS